MALLDIAFPDTDVEGFILELPAMFYSGKLNDILEDRFEIIEIPNLSFKTPDILEDRFEIYELVLKLGTREISYVF